MAEHEDEHDDLSHPRNQVRIRAVVQDDQVVAAESAEAAREVTDELRRQGARSARRRVLWGDGGSQEAMARLCALFPSLRRRNIGTPLATGAWTRHGPRWDALDVLRFLCLDAHSHGEALAARFVLSVWNPNADWDEEARKAGLLTDPEQRVRRFDLFEAMGTWDDEHREAMLTWLRDPFWP
jgi:hypothetical protein